MVYSPPEVHGRALRIALWRDDRTAVDVPWRIPGAKSSTEAYETALQAAASETQLSCKGILALVMSTPKGESNYGTASYGVHSSMKWK